MPQEFIHETTRRGKVSLAAYMDVLGQVERLILNEVDSVTWSHDLHLKHPSATLTSRSLSELSQELEENIWDRLEWADSWCHGSMMGGHEQKLGAWLRDRKSVV